MNTGAVKLEKSLSNSLLNERFEFDKEKRKAYGIICGIDEAGRGPLAGDVYAAAVILGDDVFIDGLNDSKKLSEKKREQLFDEITEKAEAYCIATATAAEIDEYNILGATFLAMKRACEGLGIKPEYALIDGNRTPELPIPCEAVVKGDSVSASIAAASILAKVARDRYMKELDAKYPEYQFCKHKGYGTKLHYELLSQYGMCPEHRRSFFKKHKI
ncbi:MAG: ribonuclease HII [Ruminiclostridium sp.]|nr:ribonuclease HII [Ruminiclostridium sp.]